MQELNLSRENLPIFRFIEMSIIYWRGDTVLLACAKFRVGYHVYFAYHPVDLSLSITFVFFFFQFSAPVYGAGIADLNIPIECIMRVCARVRPSIGGAPFLCMYKRGGIAVAGPRKSEGRAKRNYGNPIIYRARTSSPLRDD